MRGRLITLLSVLLLLVNWLACTNPVLAQIPGGNQFLDGIGETALIARYVFDGNAEDWSRNNYHATMRGTKIAYIEDSQFGRVLSLPGENDGGYIKIPGQALIGVDAVSVAGWIYVRSTVPWQRFFDFGRDTTTNFFCTPIGEEPSEGYRARITTTGWTEEQGPVAPRVDINKWVHLAVVLDPAGQTLSSYVDGVRVGHATDVDLTLEHVLHQENAAENLLYIGKSQYRDADLNARLYDVRIYSIALSDKQVTTICRNALSGEEEVTVGTKASGQGEQVMSAESISLASFSQLVGVPDITAETIVGNLPRLPYRIPGLYRNNIKGPMVRVIW
ncbi:MAG: LamG domain-containing protein, partial [Phycisphaerales bacterium]